MTAPYERVGTDAAIGVNRKRVRTLEAVLPPVIPVIPPAVDYGFVYFQWDVEITLASAGTAPADYTGIGTGVASVAGGDGVCFVHCNLEIYFDGGSTFGTAGIDWLLSLHTDYPILFQYFGSFSPYYQNDEGVGRVTDSGTGARSFVWVKHYSSVITSKVDMTLADGSQVQAANPITFANGDGIVLQMNYYSWGP